MTAVIFPLRPPRLAFAICGRRWQNEWWDNSTQGNKIAAVTGRVSLAMQQRNIDKDCRVLFGDIFIVPFLGSALGLTAMCSPG